MTITDDIVEKARAAVAHDPEVNISLMGVRTIIEVADSLRQSSSPDGQTADGWRDIATDPPTDLDRVFVAGWQKPSGRTAGYWWLHEDMTDERGVPVDHPDALKWRPLPARPEGTPSSETKAPGEEH